MLGRLQVFSCRQRFFSLNISQHVQRCNFKFYQVGDGSIAVARPSPFTLVRWRLNIKVIACSGPRVIFGCSYSNLAVDITPTCP